MNKKELLNALLKGSMITCALLLACVFILFIITPIILSFISLWWILSGIILWPLSGVIGELINKTTEIGVYD